MIKKIKKYSFIIIIPFLTSSCASILNSSFQKVSIDTDENSTVLVDGRKPEMKDGKYLIRRDAISKQITIKKEGYKDFNTAIIQYKKSPYYAVSIVPFSVAFLIPVLCDNMIRSRDYVNKISLEAKMIEVLNKEKFSSILKLNNITVTPNSNETYSWNKVPYRKFIHNKSLTKRKKDREVVNLSSSSLSSMFIELFESKGYMKYEANDIDKLYLNATVTSFSESSYYSPAMAYAGTISNYGNMITSALTIKWEVLDNNKNVVFTHQTQTKSGSFAYVEKSGKSEARSNAIKDAIEIGFLELIKTDDFNKQLDKRSVELSTYLSNNNSNKIETVTIINQNYIDTITIKNKANILYLSKKNLELRATFRAYDGIGAIRKKAFLEMIKDVPELHSYAKSNMRLKRIGFASSLVKVYNDYKLSGESKPLNQDYYNSFGLITKKEYHQGPREELLRTKLPITGRISVLQVTTNHYTNGMKTGSTIGENFKFKFTYGNTEYKKGFLLKNLKMAIGDDKEALKHIQKYRANWIARQSLKVFAVAASGFALMVADNQKPFGISDESTLFVAIPVVGIFSWAFGLPQSYKTKNITNAINTYNQNLK